MGLFSKSKPPPARSNGPVWLARRCLEGYPDVHVYQALRLFTRAEAEQYGIVPWDLLPGTEQAATDYMNRERELVETIGVTQSGKWLAWDHAGKMVKWFLPCPQPPAPGA
jgi:hypothetical protein